MDALIYLRGRVLCRMFRLHGITCRGRWDPHPAIGRWVRGSRL